MVKARTKASKPSTRFKIGKRVYELVPFLEKGERRVTGDEMVKRAKKLKANLGEEDATFILKHQAEIPEEFRGKFYLVFTDWRDPSNLRNVGYLFWNAYYWDEDGDWLDDGWNGDGRLVRRVK